MVGMDVFRIVGVDVFHVVEVVVPGIEGIDVLHIAV